MQVSRTRLALLCEAWPGYSCVGLCMAMSGATECIWMHRSTAEWLDDYLELYAMGRIQRVGHTSYCLCWAHGHDDV